MEYATVNYKTPLLASKVGVNYWYFLYFNLHANCVNIAEAAHITSTVRPPRTLNPLAPHSSMPLAALLVSSRGSRWKHRGGKVPDVHPISLVA